MSRSELGDMTEQEVNLKYRIVCETTTFIPLLRDPAGSLYFQREWLGSLSCRQMGTKKRQKRVQHYCTKKRRTLLMSYTSVQIFNSKMVYIPGSCFSCLSMDIEEEEKTVIETQTSGNGRWNRSIMERKEIGVNKGLQWSWIVSNGSRTEMNITIWL